MAVALPTLPHARLREVLVVSLKPPPKDWTEAIAAIAVLFQNARVCFYKDDGEGDADPLTGTGTDGGIEIIWAGAARVQQLRSPRQFATDYQAGSNRAFRFQLDKEAGVPFLPEGVKARVLNAGVSGDGEMDPGDVHLELLSYVVDSAINGSHQAVKTVELTATMRPVEWTWDVNEDGEVIAL